MSIYSDKLAYVQVVINCRYSVAQMCTREDTLAHYLGAQFIDDVMRQNTLITVGNQTKDIYHEHSKTELFLCPIFEWSA